MNTNFPFAPDNARTLALAVLLDCRAKEGYISELLDKHLRLQPLSAPDRRLATTLAYGVLRRQGTLDAMLRPLITRPMHKVEPWLIDVLRLGAFQLGFLTHIPPHAAIFETVELTAALQRPRAKGFVNGVLRELARTLSDDHAGQPAADAVPIDSGRYRKLTKPLLPDPQTQPAKYLADAFALPEWLAERWLQRWSWDACLDLGFWFAGPAPMVLRCNTLRTDREQCLAALADAGIAAEPAAQPDAIRLAEPLPVRDLPGWEQGWFVVQDESALEAAAALEVRPGFEVLDLCAAPGGKTTYLAARMNNQGRIVACDTDAQRLQSLSESCRRLGIDIIDIQPLDASNNQEPPPGPFDAILVDVPCSNTGVLGRRPEVRWRLKPNDLRRLVPLQTTLLAQACQRLRPGGNLVYSTCSIEPEENQQVIKAILQSTPSIQLEAENEQLPGHPADGGYWARLRLQA